MHRPSLAGVFIILALQLWAADVPELQQRRQRAMVALPDGVLLVAATAWLPLTDDGFRQNAPFFYLTGLENTGSAVLAIDGVSRRSALFVDPHAPFGTTPEVEPGPATAQRLGLDQVADWESLEAFLAERAKSSAKIYYVSDRYSRPLLPAAFALRRNATAKGLTEDDRQESDPYAPPWIMQLAQRWPSLRWQEASEAVSAWMAIQSPTELTSLRAAARATVPALTAGIRAIHPGVSQRAVEVAIVAACWQAGAHGVSFWPWAMAGSNSVFPAPFGSLSRYDHLDTIMRTGDLVRVDVGCEWDHYQGDLGRTVPVSGRYTAEQRETWNIFVGAYQAGVRSLRDGVEPDKVYEVWRSELQSHSNTARSDTARRAIASWSRRENVPYWQIHTMNLDAGGVSGGLKAGMTVDFEPIASIDGQGFYLEDMFLITASGAELLTPGVPYAAEELEAAMR